LKAAEISFMSSGVATSLFAVVMSGIRNLLRETTRRPFRPQPC
jgi:hypothetical protein